MNMNSVKADRIVCVFNWIRFLLAMALLGMVLAVDLMD